MVSSQNNQHNNDIIALLKDIKADINNRLTAVNDELVNLSNYT
jgi:hypothetical protein